MSIGLNIFRTSSPTNRGMTGAPITTDHEHMAFLAMRCERKAKEKADGRSR